MMTKDIKHFIAAGLLCCGAAALTACSDWDDHYVDAVSASGSGQTLWQTMQQRPELSDFCEVLSQTKVYKHHAKTAVSYADLLDGVQTFTVLAPVNGTFDKDSLLRLLTTNQGDSMVERSFVGNHLSYAIVSDAAVPTDFFLLNKKPMTLGQGKADNVSVKESNVNAKGGLLHVLQNTLPYHYNLYEVMLSDPRYSFIGQQLRSYEQDEFLPGQSVEGDMVDGEQLYVDSVFRERNILLERVGELAAEDSSYIFVVAQNDEWQRAWQEAMTYFHYSSAEETGDSLQRLYANQALFTDAIFSRTIQSSPNDSLITYNYDKKYPQYHCFRKPFEPGGILYGATATDYSNGTLYTVPQWPFTPQMTYQREIKIEGERTSLILKDSLCTATSRVLAADSVSEGGYLAILPQANSNWRITFRLDNVLSGAYDIMAIILPEKVYDPTSTIPASRIAAEINYVNEQGEDAVDNLGNASFVTDPDRVDTIMLAENYRFPTTNYGLSEVRTSITLKTSVNGTQARRYTRRVYLDCIYLRPRTSKSE